MYRFFFAIAGVIVGACLGFLVALLGSGIFELLYGLHLFIGGIVGATVGGVLGAVFGDAIGSRIENAFGERAILLLFALVFIVVIGCLIWLISESS